MRPLQAWLLLLIFGSVLTAAAVVVHLQRTVPVPPFAELPLDAKKRAFFAYLKPEIVAGNQALLEERRRVVELREKVSAGAQLNWWDQRYLRRLAERYEYATEETPPEIWLEPLLERVDIVPVSLVLIQAAKESGWGSSRFARTGYNFFGQQCFEAGCGFVPARRSAGKQHEVARFSSVREAVRAYLHNLNTHYRYEEFRELRAAARREGEPLKGTALARGLEAYSERGEAYVHEVVAMIRQNALE